MLGGGAQQLYDGFAMTNLPEGPTPFSSPKPEPTVLMSANSFWNLAHFRGKLIEGLICKGYRVALAAPRPDHDWARSTGAESIHIAIDRSGLNPIRDIVLLKDYHKLIRRLRPKFYLGFTAKPNLYGSIAARLTGAASIPNISGLGTAFINPGPLSWLVTLLYRVGLRKCPIVFFQNADDRDMFVSKKIVRPEQARLLPGSGVDLDRFKPSTAAIHGVSFLFVGRLLGDKGTREYVEAARILRQQQPSWRFQLLGAIDEGNRSGIKQAELDLWIEEGTVEYLGETKDVRPFLSRATSVVLPSYREGLPRSLLEAAAMAKPLIASDVPGNRHLVRHGINGLLCAARDHRSLADAMRRLGQMTPEERGAMGRAAREIVEREYDERLVVQTYLDALAQLGPVPGVA